MGCLPDNAFVNNVEMGLRALGPALGGVNICSIQNTQCNANAMQTLSPKDQVTQYDMHSFPNIQGD